ncbi:MAG: RsmD family RNA methyltransferase [Bacteroidales bacterium]|nr:RsmD family RNA methyltransferase [Bacteroidales bacterium]
MRIISGSLRGKTILPPSGYAARPTTDFAKEGLFNILCGSVDFEKIAFLDLFSGTGSISYEMWSRGCRDIVAVEMNPANAGFIKRTARTLGIDSLQVVHHNVFDFLGICTKEFDLIFADPPYAIEGLDTLPGKILPMPFLKDGGMFVLEHPAEYNFENEPGFLKERKYGNVHFSFFVKPGPQEGELR